MEQSINRTEGPKKGLLQTEELYEYILETSVYPREPAPLKELRHVTASHPRCAMATVPDAGQLMTMFLKLVNTKKTIEIGVYTGYSLLLTALTIPDDGEVHTYYAYIYIYKGYPFNIMFSLKAIIDVWNIYGADRGHRCQPKGLRNRIADNKRTGVEHKINFIESAGLPVLDKLLQDQKNEGTFDFAYVDVDKDNHLNYHKRLLKLVRVGGIIAYDNTLWVESVAMPEESVPEFFKRGRKYTIELNKSLAADSQIQLSHVPVGDGCTFCMRTH